MVYFKIDFSLESNKYTLISRSVLPNIILVKMVDLENKVALVTGASSGIGAAIVLRLLKLRMKVVGFARRQERVKELGKGYEGQLFAVKGDVTKEDDILNALSWTQENVGPLYLLINNAGILPEKNFFEEKINQEFKNVLDTNVLGLTLFMKEGIEVMRKNNTDGIIVNINSVCGHNVRTSKYAIYHASKFGVTAFTEAVRLGLAEIGSKIRITSISPGTVETEMTEEFFSKYPFIGSDEIANAIEYVISQNPKVNITELTIRPVGEHLV